MSIKSFLFLIVISSQIFCSSKEEIKVQIDRLLNAIPASTKVGILIYNPILRDTIFQVNHSLSMIPASNTKLFTTAVALSNLGSDFKISTKIFTDDFNVEDGAINGNLYIKGFGNSTFSHYDLEQLVSELTKKGIIKITGNIIGDDTYFDNVYRRDDWIADETANVKLPPISAITVDRNRKVVQKRRGRRIRTTVTAVENPPLNAASLLRLKLIEHDIKIEYSPNAEN